MLLSEDDEVVKEKLRGEVDEDDDDDEEECTCKTTVAAIKDVPRSILYRSFVLRYGDEMLISFEAKPAEDTERLLDRAAYICMSMMAFAHGIMASEAIPVIKEYLNIEVRGG